MKPIQKIVIVGGGFAGWYTAASFQNHLPEIELVLIDSQKHPTIGVGEVTGFDAPIHFRRLLGVDDPKEIFKQTGAIYKFGTNAIDFYQDNQTVSWGKFPNLKVNSLQNYYQPFDEHDFYEPWNRQPGDIGVLLAWCALNKNSNKTFADYSQEVGDQNFFIKNPVAPVSNGEMFLPQKNSYGYQTDAEQTVQYLKDLVYTRDYSRFSHLSKTVVNVNHTGNSVTSLDLEDGSTIEADLFIDCSGIHRVIMKTGVNDSWQSVGDDYNNSVWVFPSAYVNPKEEVRGSSDFYGEDHGWRFKVRLYHRMGNGYIFNKNHVDPEIVKQRLLEVAGSTRLAEPKMISWEPGHYTTPWQGNVIPMGLSGWFIDPYDAPTFDMHSKAIEDIIGIIQNWDNETDPRKKYNQYRSYNTEERRLRIDLSFGLSKRSGPFWDRARALAKKNHALKQIEDIILERRTDLEARLNWYWIHMYIRVALSAGVDMSDWSFPAITTADQEMAESYYKFTRDRNKYIATKSWPNYYEWLKDTIFEGKESSEMLAKLNPKFVTRN